MAVTKATFVCLLVCSFVSLLVPFETKKKKRKWQTDVHPRRTIEPDQSQSRKPNQTKKKAPAPPVSLRSSFLLASIFGVLFIIFLVWKSFLSIAKKKTNKKPEKTKQNHQPLCRRRHAGDRPGPGAGGVVLDALFHVDVDGAQQIRPVRGADLQLLFQVSAASHGMSQKFFFDLFEKDILSKKKKKDTFRYCLVLFMEMATFPSSFT